MSALPKKRRKMSDLAQQLLMLREKPLNLKDYPYLIPIYDTDWPRINLFTGRQIAKCLVKTTVISRANGELTTVGEVQAGDRVATVAPGLRAGTGSVTGVYANGVADCVEVRTKGGAVLRLTANHLLRTAHGYTEAGALVRGSAVACAEVAGVFEDQPVDGGRVRVILTAYMLGDGCCGLSSNWSVTSECPAVLDECQGLQAADSRRGRKAGTHAKTINYRVDAAIRGWLETDGVAGKYSYEKSVPSWVFRLSKANTALFLSRLWATDGSINKQDQTVNVDYTSTSEKLARQVQSLLRKFGIRTTLRSFVPTCDGQKHRRAWRVRVAGYDAVLRFYREIGEVPGKPPVYTTVKTERRSTLVTLPPEMNQMLRDAYAPIEQTPKRLRKSGIFHRGLAWKKYRLSYEKFNRFLECYRELGLDVSALERYTGGVWWDTVESVTPVGKHEVFDLEVPGDHNYLADTGIVSHNSTTLASICTLDAAFDPPGSSQVIVTPLQDQAFVFSTQRLHDFIHESPAIKYGYFTGSNVIDQVLMKRFQNNNIISMGYAQRTADRLRGRSAGRIKFDEFQDITPEVVPVIEEMAFRVIGSSFWKCGTPKSLGNHMEGERNASTGNEWAVRCEATGCKKWNYEWDEKNIGKKGVICRHCGALLNTDQGHWISARKLNPEGGIEAVSFRIPQLIVRPIMSNPGKWLELLSKQRKYPQPQFLNEVLGLPADNGSQPVTLDELRQCCVRGRKNAFPDPQDRSLPPLVLGFDWAYAQNKSFSAAVIGGWNPFPSRFDVYYYKVFKGAEADPNYQTQWIIETVNKLGIKLVGSDYGMGYVQNLQLINRLGEETVAQMWHTPMRAASKARRAVWEPKLRKWHLARTAVLTDTFESIRRKLMRFPDLFECGEMFDHIQAETMEFNEVANVLRYTNAKPDDVLHALTFATLAGELLMRGDFAGHLGSGTPNPGPMYDLSQWNEEMDGLNPALYG